MVKKVKGRHLLGLLILLVLLGLGFVFMRGLQTMEPEQILERVPENVDLALQKFSYTETQGGVRRWTVQAESAVYDRQNETTQIEDLQVIFFDPSGQSEQVILTARQGRIDVAARYLEVWDEVVVTTDDGGMLHTERLQYRDDEKLITTDADVRYESPGMLILGRGMNLDVIRRTVNLRDEVRAWLRHSLKKAG